MANEARNVSDHWSLEEFKEIDFGDCRLNERFTKTAGFLYSWPSSPINKACGNWANTKAAYRMFKNERIESDVIMTEHRKNTLKRAQTAGPWVLVIQDTSYLNFDKHKATAGLGHIGTSHGKNPQGMMMHSLLAVSPTGLPLGLIDQEIWARDKAPMKEKRNHRLLPIEQKETARWIRFLRKTKEHFDGTAQRPVSIADREADIFEFLLEAQVQDIAYVVRAARDRKVEREGSPLNGLWTTLETQPCAGIHTLDVIDSKTGEKRSAFLEVRFASLEVRPPRVSLCSKKRRNGQKWHYVRVHAILVRESNPPTGAVSLEWMLLTNLPVGSFEEAVEKIRWYRLRWHIEEFHKVLKSGCTVEDCRLSSADRLKRYLTLASIIAWRLYWITHVNRHNPEAPCTEVLEEHEWRALYCKSTGSTAIPEKPPTLRQAIRWIAQLGGFLARKCDGDPGIVTVWRGWQRLQDISESWLLFNRREATCG